MATGDIGSVQASLEFEAGYGGEPFIFHIAGHVYAVLYYQVPLHGILKTFTISDDGLTLALTGASLEIDDTRFAKGKLTHIAGNVYAICYQGIDDDGWLKTVTISDDGLTLALTGASLEWDAVQGAQPTMIHIAGNVYAIVYWGPLNDGWLKTVTISDDGLTLALTGSSLEFDGVEGSYPDIHHRDGTVYAIIYQGPLTDGWLCTVNIADNGTITSPIIASLNWTPIVADHGLSPKGIHIGGDVYAVFCQNAIKTLSVSANGLTLAIIDEESGPAVTGVPSGFIPVSGDVYVFCYEGPGNVGSLLTKEIPSDGEMPIGNIDSLNFNTPGEEPQIIHVAGNIYAIVARGTDSDGWLYTVDIETVSAPTVSADPATGVGAAVATLNGTLDDDGGEACDCGFEWGETIAYGNTTPTQSRTTGQTFAQAISGLTPGATYHFRAFATNEAGTSYSADRTFTTIGTPTVTTDPAAGVGAAVATLNGTLDDDGGEACDCGFQWGETVAYGNTTPTQSRTTGQTFSQAISGLTPATTYHFRAFATNSAGTSYGADQTFTTPVGLPILTTEAASAIGLNGATLNGALTSDGGEPCYCGFEWGETIPYSTTTPTQRKVTGEVFSQPLLHLGEAAQYHFRAFATNSAGTAYGEDRTIDTLFRTNKAYALARYEV